MPLPNSFLAWSAFCIYWFTLNEYVILHFEYICFFVEEKTVLVKK